MTGGAVAMPDHTTNWSGKRTILLVDDETIVVDVVERYLLRDGYAVRIARDGLTALDLARSERPDLIILDLMLPGLNGLEVAQRIRAESRAPIIILSARGEETDKIIGLGLGADDYVTKPFSPKELVARVAAVLRRTTEPLPIARDADDQTLNFGALRIDPRGRRVTREALPLDLTAREFDLLLFLARHPDQVLHQATVARSGLGLRVLRRFEHRHRPHPPVAREGRAGPGAPAIPENGLGRRLQVRGMTMLLRDVNASGGGDGKR